MNFVLKMTLKIIVFVSPQEITSWTETASDFPCCLIDFSFCSNKESLCQGKALTSRFRHSSS